MTHIPNKSSYNPKDYYLLVFKEDGTIYEKFSKKRVADKFLHKHPLKDELELKVNDKYKK